MTRRRPCTAPRQGSIETVAVLLRDPRGRALLTTRDAHYNAAPLGWCCHGSQHGNSSHDHVGVAQLLLDAGAPQGPDTEDASPSVQAVLAGMPEPRVC